MVGAVNYDQLAVTTTPSPLPNGVAIATTNVAADSFDLTINNTDTATHTVTVTVRARIFTITQTERREIDRLVSQGQYGTQTLVTLPAWFTDASYGYAERELNRLSQPLLYASLPLPRAQKGRAARNQLQGAERRRPHQPLGRRGRHHRLPNDVRRGHPPLAG